MKKLLLGFLILGLAFPALAIGWKDGSFLTLKGVVRLVGNAPFLKLVLTTEGRDVILLSEKKERLKSLQGKPIQVRGRLKIRRVHFGNPKYDYDEYSLRAEKIEALRR